MNDANYLHLIAGLPQIAVAYYLLRLERRFGLARVGWVLVASITLLAVLYLLFFFQPLQTFPSVAIKMDIAFGLASLFLLTLMMFLEELLKERARVREIELQAHRLLKTRVAEQTVELTKANAELTQTAASLRSEIDNRKRMQTQMEATHRDLLAVTRQAGMSEVATGVLHNVGNVLNSVNVSAGLLADHLRHSKIEYLCRVTQLLREHSANLGVFITGTKKAGNCRRS